MHSNVGAGLSEHGFGLLDLDKGADNDWLLITDRPHELTWTASAQLSQNLQDPGLGVRKTNHLQRPTAFQCIERVSRIIR